MQDGLRVLPFALSKRLRYAYASSLHTSHNYLKIESYIIKFYIKGKCFC